MVIAQGEIWWADRGDPVGSEAGHHRPWLIVQSDSFNRSRVSTVLCVPMTGNLRLARSPGNVLLKTRDTGLEKDSVANVSLMAALDRTLLVDFSGRITAGKLAMVFAGIDTVLGR